MTSKLVCAALACVALAMTSSAAFAKQGDPIPGIPVGLEGDPDPIAIAHGVTDGEGHISFGKLLPGKYVLIIDGPGFVAAMDRLHPAAPEKKKSGSSFSLGFGGFSSGGGSSHKSSSGGGAGPVGGAPGGSSHSSSTSSGGGVGMGVSVPVGGGSDSGSGGENAQVIRVRYSVSIADLTQGTYNGTKFSSETPYCRDTAGQGMRMGFTVTNTGGVPTPQDVTFTATINWGDGTSQ